MNSSEFQWFQVCPIWDWMAGIELREPPVFQQLGARCTRPQPPRHANLQPLSSVTSGSRNLHLSSAFAGLCVSDSSGMITHRSDVPVLRHQIDDPSDKFDLAC